MTIPAPRIFLNEQAIPYENILTRLKASDPFSKIDLIQSQLEDGQVINSVLVWSETLTDLQIIAALEPAQTAAEVNAITVKSGALSAASGIPDWATKNEEWILDWLLDNIGTPLAVPIPAGTLSNAQIRTIFVNMQTIMNQMYLAQRANARMTIALRNETWPNLEEQ